MIRIAALLTALFAAFPAAAASYDCTLPSLAPDERAICDTRDLNDADVRMTTMLEMLSGLFMMGRRGEMMDDQRDWLHARMACGADIACLRASYARRIAELQALYDTIDRPL